MNLIAVSPLSLAENEGRACLETVPAAIPYKRTESDNRHNVGLPLFAGARRTTIGVYSIYKLCIHLSREEHKFGAGPATLILRLSTC